MNCFSSSNRHASRIGNLGYNKNLQYWCDFTGRSLKFSLTALQHHVHSFEENADQTTKRMNETQFGQMLGLIGNSFIAKRMFAVIKTKKEEESFDLKDYLIY